MKNTITLIALTCAIIFALTGCSTLPDSPDTWPPYQKDINFREVWE